MRVNRFKVSWLWPDDSLSSMMVPQPILPQVVVLLDQDVRCHTIRVDGMHYDDFVRIYGGVVLNLGGAS